MTVLTTFSGSINSISGVSPYNPDSNFTAGIFGPSLKCDALPDTNITSLEKIISNMKSSAPRGKPLSSNLTFVGVIPGISSNNSTQTLFDPNLPLNLDSDRSERSEPAATEIWIKLGTNKGFQYLSCALYNCSLTIQAETSLGHQNANITNVEYLEPVPWAEAILRDSDDGGNISLNHEKMSYQSIWMAMAQLLTGYFSEGRINSRLHQTTLLMASEFADFHQSVFGSSQELVGERTPLARLIEEASRNVTLNLLGSDHFL